MRIFLDTNVLAYWYDDDEPVKRDRAVEGVQGCPERPWISTQVLVELHRVLTRRFGYPRPDAQEVIESNPFHVQPATAELVYRAVETATRHQLSIFDAMIVEAAVAAGCDELWTEDLATGAVLRGVRVVNPFA